MNIVFFGSGRFAVPALKYLLNRDNVSLKAVITQPDRRAMRGMHLKPTDVADFISKSDFKAGLFKPEDINSESSKSKLQSLSADIFIVASYGSIISKEILSLASIAPLNIHGSLLPKYRGAAPVSWALINGEEETGVTIFKMNERLDSGDIILKKSFVITEDMDAESLERVLADESVGLLERVLESLDKGGLELYPQKGEASYAPKIKRADGLIDWSLSAADIANRVRGLLPWPGVFSYLDFKVIKIYKAKAGFQDYSDAVASEVVRVENDHFSVKCGRGLLDIFEVQLEGKKRMAVKDFLLGHKIKPGLKLGA